MAALGAPGVGSPEWWLDRLGRRLTERAGRATFTRVGRRDDVGTERRLVDATGMALYQAYCEGRHRETYKIRRVIEAFGLRMPIYVNLAGGGRGGVARRQIAQAASLVRSSPPKVKPSTVKPVIRPNGPMGISSAISGGMTSPTCACQSSFASSSRIVAAHRAVP